MKSLFGRNINILKGSEASVLSELTFSAGLLPNSFSISVCIFDLNLFMVY